MKQPWLPAEVLTAVKAKRSVIPVKADKRPAIPEWKPYQERRPTGAEFTAWASQNPAGWAQVCGAVSGVITLDFDGEAGADTMRELGLDPHRRTGSGGFHVDVVYPGRHIHTLNAKSKAELGRRWPGLDVRADGGYAVIAGRNEAGAYEWLRPIDPDPPDVLPDEIWAFLKGDTQPERPAPGSPPADSRHERLAEPLLRRALQDAPSMGRNNAGFAMVLQARDNGFSESEALDLLRTFAARAPATNLKGRPEPYTDEEMRASVREAYQRPPREPWPEREHYRSNGNGHTPSQGSVNPGQPSEAPQPIPEPYAFEPASTSGWVYNYISWREMVSDAPSEYAEALALGILSTVAGPRLRIPIRQQPRPVPCNLYVCLLGPSTIARKSSEIGAAENMLRDLSPDFLMDTPGSPEAFVQDLARHATLGGCLVYDEFAWTFSAIRKRQHLSDLKGYLLRAYDNAPISRRLRDKRSKEGTTTDADVASDPALTILAASTPERLAMVSTRDDVEDGFWPRWAMVWPETLPPRRALGPPDDASEALRADLKARLLAIDQRLGSGIQAVLTEDAWALANDALTAYEERASVDFENGAVFGRAELRLLKVAALLALADDSNTAGNVKVTAEHVEGATRLVGRWLEDALRFSGLIGLNEFEGSLNRAYVALQRRRGAANRRDIARVAHVPARIMDEIERTLVDRGLIEVLEATGHHSAAEWRLVNV